MTGVKFIIDSSHRSIFLCGRSLLIALPVNDLPECYVFAKCQHILQDLIHRKLSAPHISVLHLIIIKLRVLPCHVQRGSIRIVPLVKRGAVMCIIELYADLLGILGHDTISVQKSGKKSKSYMSISKLILGLLLGGMVLVLYI